MDPKQSRSNERSYTRRSFITTGAGASAALYLAACVRRASPPIALVILAASYRSAGIVVRRVLNLDLPS